jgi:hypothetical protein
MGISQTVQSSCIAHDSIVAKYETDADRLAVKAIFATNSNDMYDVVINENMSERILNALISVYNVTNMPERDEVIDSFDIHTGQDPSLNKFSVRVDSNELWAQNIKNGIIPTGNSIVDSLSDVYNLVIDNYYTYAYTSHAHTIIFYSQNNLNLKPLALELLNVPGVYTSNVSLYQSDGNDIDVVLHSDYIELTYIHGWGFCNLGCMFKKFYTFKVYNDCSVEFLYSTELGMNNTELTTSISIYPNPVNTELHITNGGENSNYQMVNLLGEVVKKGQVSSSNTINITELNSGVYFIKIGNNKSLKFIKR